MRRHREAAGITPKAAADALRSVAAKVSYTERGAHSFKPRDLTEVLFDLYDVPEEERQVLLAACRAGRGRGWWQAYDTETLPEWAQRYVGLEQGATTLGSWESLYPHGLVQTRAYAEALMHNKYALLLDEDEIAARIELRLERQAALTRQDHPLTARFILDEAILRRVIGGPDVMADQLRHLADLADHPNVTVQVVPFSHGTHPEATGAFSILAFGEPDDPGVVYLEGRNGAEYIDDDAEVEDHATLFDQLSDLALDPAATATLIRRTAKEHKR
jgi:hypothetical protein